MATILSDLGLGPKMYGVFPNGRLEQFIEVIDQLARILEAWTAVFMALGEFLGKKHAIPRAS